MTFIWIAAAVAIFGLLALGHMVRASYRYRVDVQEAAFERLPQAFDGTTLLFISDVHRRVIPNRLIDAFVQAGGADLVLIGGDLREKKVPDARIRENLRRLSRIAPMYMVHGNHDYDEDIRPFEVLLEEERVRLLANESVVLEQKDGSRIRLAGVDDPRTDHERPDLALADMEDGRGQLFTILLSHDPIIAKRLKGDEYIDLVLSGHTHGGQVALPVIGPLWRGEGDSGYWRGWFEFDRPARGVPKMRLFVSCGFGTSRLPIRLMTEPQLHRITLRSSGAHPDQDRSKRGR